MGVSGAQPCDTVARNASFARLASSAARRAASVRASARFRSVMSCKSSMR
jgi:hypothetical protein